MANICVFCGGVEGVDQKLIDFSVTLGEHIAKHNHTLIYGGGIYGLMGGVSRGANSSQGRILGVIPDFFLQKEGGSIINKAGYEIIVTKTLEERLRIFFEKSDIFLILPGGIGTLNEFIQALELKKQNKLRGKIYLINIYGYYDNFISQMNIIVEQKFLSQDKMQTLFTVISDPTELFTLLSL